MNVYVVLSIVPVNSVYCGTVIVAGELTVVAVIVPSILAAVLDLGV